MASNLEAIFTTLKSCTDEKSDTQKFMDDVNKMMNTVNALSTACDGVALVNDLFGKIENIDLCAIPNPFSDIADYYEQVDNKLAKAASEWKKAVSAVGNGEMGLSKGYDILSDLISSKVDALIASIEARIEEALASFMECLGGIDFDFAQTFAKIKEAIVGEDTNLLTSDATLLNQVGMNNIVSTGSTPIQKISSATGGKINTDLIEPSTSNSMCEQMTSVLQAGIKTVMDSTGIGTALIAVKIAAILCEELGKIETGVDDLSSCITGFIDNLLKQDGNSNNSDNSNDCFDNALNLLLNLSDGDLCDTNKQFASVNTDISKQFGDVLAQIGTALKGIVNAMSKLLKDMLSLLDVNINVNINPCADNFGMSVSDANSFNNMADEFFNLITDSVNVFNNVISTLKTSLIAIGNTNIPLFDLLTTGQINSLTQMFVPIVKHCTSHQHIMTTISGSNLIPNAVTPIRVPSFDCSQGLVRKNESIYDITGTEQVTPVKDCNSRV